MRYTKADYDAALAGLETRPIWTMLVYSDLFIWAALTSVPKALRLLPRLWNRLIDFDAHVRGLCTATRRLRSTHIKLDAWARSEGPAVAICLLPVLLALFTLSLAFTVLYELTWPINRILNAWYKRV